MVPGLPWAVQDAEQGGLTFMPSPYLSTSAKLNRLQGQKQQKQLRSHQSALSKA